MIFLEYYSKGESHSDGNASLLALLLKQFTEEKIYVFCSNGHFECIKRILKSNNISLDRIIFNPIEAYPNKLEYQRFVIDWNLLNKIFNFMKENNETKLFTTYTTTIFLYYLKLFLFFNPQISAITTIHSELERLYINKYSSGFSGIRRVFTMLYCFVFGLFLPLSINLKNYKCLVYGESIKKNLLKRVPFINKDSIIAIDHPYIINSSNDFTPLQNQKVNFGLIGLIDKKKNGVNLKNLLNLLNEQDSLKFKISLIGHIRNSLTEEYLKDVLNYEFIERSSNNNEFISKDLRDKLEEQVDYNIYTYNIDGYKLTASGAFMDAVNFEKPIIAIKNDFFEHYFSKYGNIGYLFDNVDDMSTKMTDIINSPSIEEYMVQKENIKRIKKDIDINNIIKNTKIEF